ncbi:hypothetical protein IWW57_004808 [Coemansia sp. S610]|nr:hypothetical protein IWW57_004808 [Coemansia sp. S610]
MQRITFGRALQPTTRSLTAKSSHPTKSILLQTQRRLASNKANTDSDKDASYEETAKGQLRDYQKWRRHFTWKPERVNQILKEYALWSVLGLLAYYNLTKREEAEEYDAKTFVLVDSLEEKISRLDPLSPLLAGTTREARAPEDFDSQQQLTVREGGSVFF